jgi:hypothetical protein
MYGIVYDYTKCFDYIPWTIEHGLLNALGLPPRIANPLVAFSKNLNRRFKIGNSIGPVIPNTNSIMQGCPLAIIRINSLIAAWTRVIHSCPLTDLCNTSAYVDDKNMPSPPLEHLQNGINTTIAFDIAIAAEVNWRLLKAIPTESNKYLLVAILFKLSQVNDCLEDKCASLLNVLLI